jgi:hypothetical protein
VVFVGAQKRNCVCTRHVQVVDSKEKYIPLMKIAAAVLLLTASLAVPATAHADCGDPDQSACTGPVPTVDQIVGIMAELTDPNIPAVNKGNVITPPLTAEEAATIDDHLHRMQSVNILPLSFVVTDIEPAPNDLAGATLSTTGSFHQYTRPGPIVLIDQDGHWLITHDTAMTAMNAFWSNATRRKPVVPGNSF